MVPSTRPADTGGLAAGNPARSRVAAWLRDLLALGIRLWIGRIFLFSGLAKLDDWPGTVMLFRYEYQVPVLGPVPAAWLAVVFEIACPILLAVGLAARLAALPLLAMAVVIQFWLGAANPAYDQAEHVSWMLLLLTVILGGPGRLSLDHLRARRLARRHVPDA